MGAVAVGDWVPCVEYGEQIVFALDAASQTWHIDVALVTVGAGQLGFNGEVGTVEREAEVLCKRVVGPLCLRMAFLETHSLLVHERIRVGLQADDGTQSFYALDLNDAADANEPFLWERCSMFELPSLQVATWPDPFVSHPGWGPLDVRVARRLRRQDVLVYSCSVTHVTATVFDASDVVSVFPFLRTWARALS